MLFQERLRKYREAAGYKTAKEFAMALGMPYTSYIAYENRQREPKYDVLMEIADKLGVAIDELLGYEPQQLAEEQTGFDKKATGERIKEYRVARGLTQHDLANRANITRIALGNYERGQRIPTIDIFARIAMALNVSIDELMGYRPEQSSIWHYGMADSVMTFGDNLKHLRENAGYKQAKDFAKAAGIPYSSYVTYERGSWPNEANLKMIASTLQVSMNELIGYRLNQLSPLQQIKRDFERAGYEVNEEGEPCDGYEITTPGEKYPFRVENQDDLKQIYHQIKLDVLRAQKKVWKDNIYKSLLKYERKQYHEKEKYFMFLQKKEQ
ncbi:helix-turn-helix domain-containing protein [Megasphaera sp. WILCCON 0056]|uniref:helix-turn-helix domain-containing protein n=1 Tax=Megasphaera sp. WILCCON 0056 TaxID=3345340 RepID=UPI003A808AE6